MAPGNCGPQRPTGGNASNPRSPSRDKRRGRQGFVGNGHCATGIAPPVEADADEPFVSSVSRRHRFQELVVGFTSVPWF
ncbi:hypothetical protein B0T16DRAFT_234032 [Cercophora newfieldiana]|uniref:Uncharacterized protein n=1 Tax=Cercophora newfieldiana TaxID=92897 RepID=A0AA39XRH5_9PEZI|nr:hypothetical protein B0T16DRAFT_234032 [Cercophora newfieldiana]